MNQPYASPPRSSYIKPVLTALSAQDEPLAAFSPALSAALPAMDLLRAVQSSLDELGLRDARAVAELKLAVLEEVSAGRLANAVNLAIVQTAALAADAASAAARDVN